MSVAVLITSIEHTDLLANTLKHNSENLVSGCEILVADQSWTKVKELQFAKYSNVKYFEVPYNFGLSASRNFLVDKASWFNCDYCLLMADNQWFDHKSDFSKVIEFLEKDTNRGIVGLDLNYVGEPHKDWVYDIELVNGKGFKLIIPNREPIIEENVRYQPADFVKNFFIAKTQCLQAVNWDNNLKMKEHLDFMYRVKQSGWLLFYTNSIQANRLKNRSGKYHQLRMQNLKEGTEYLRTKWGIQSEFFIAN